jgi:protein involved in polysaccharide export with SLBB domain
MKLFDPISRWLEVCGALVLALVLGAGCSSMATSSGPNAEATTASAPAMANQTTSMSSAGDVLRPNDMITVVFSGVPGPPERHSEQIKEDGTLQLQYLDEPVKAIGLTPGQLQERIHDLYVPKLFKRLTVTVLTENRVFFVTGEVKRPDRYSYIGEMTVIKAIAAAGDFTDFADKGSVLLTRLNGQKFTINVKKARKDHRLDLPIFPGDAIHVSRRII